MCRKVLLPLCAVFLLGQWSTCQPLPDLSDPCASSATQLHDNDIAYFPSSLVPQDEMHSNNGGETTRRRRGATSEQHRLWPDGVVYYTISERYNAAERRLILEAMKHWENHTCIRFHQRSSQPHYINIFPGSGCCSYVGRISYGRQPQGVSVGRTCFNFHTIVHEIGHVVGFWHEQSRPDRDQYVDVIDSNIAPGYESNFRQLPSWMIDSLNVGYDYNSIMHYDPNFFSRHPSLDTLRAKDPSIPIGRARVLSQFDIEQTNRLYKCNTSALPPLGVVLPPLTTPPPFPTLPYSCVYHLTTLQGAFQSPGYPHYRHNTDCVWMIKVPPGYQIQLLFSPVELENTYQCIKDYLKVFDNFQSAGTAQTLCAYYNSYNYRVASSNALIHYHTDSYNNHLMTRTPLAGFRATYRVVDINECVSVTCSHSCRNLPGTFQCSCPRGYFLSADGLNCFDMNECALGNGGCDHQCINTGGSYHCQCRSEFELQSDRHSCRLPGSSCSRHNGGCHHICTETATTRLCSCRHGYVLHSDGTSCIDDNECYQQRSGCHHDCTNTIGSYMCSCRHGYRLAANQHTCIPERSCSIDNGGCEQVCRNSVHGVVCSCRQGHRLATDDRSCEDIDECLERIENCQDICINTNGSFICSCSEGLTLNHDQRTCVDVDECRTGENNCPFKNRCINYYGTYRCSCPPGYFNTADGQGCEDQDECAQGFSAFCSHSCRNIPGSFRCECPTGFALQDFYTCQDVNECLRGTDQCDHSSGASCENTLGSYVCLCPDGYISNGHSCVESILGFECEFADECDEGFVCAESDGLDYNTCQCPPGSILSTNGLYCQDSLSTTQTMATHYSTTPIIPTTIADVSTSLAETPSPTPSPHITRELRSETTTSAHLTTRSPITNEVIAGTNTLSSEILSTALYQSTSLVTEQASTPPLTSAPEPTPLPTTEAQTEHKLTPTEADLLPTELVLTSTEADLIPTKQELTEIEQELTDFPTISPSSTTLSNSLPTTMPEKNQKSTETKQKLTHSTTVSTIEILPITSLPTNPSDDPSTNTSPTQSPTTVPSEPLCGGTLRQESGFFHSTNWPETYPVNIDCEWRIELPDSRKVVRLTFNHSVFGIAGRMPHCTKDWIKVYDGHSYNDHFWGPLCSFWKPDPIKTTSHKAMVVFHAGPRHNRSRKGFRLTFTSVDAPTTTSAPSTLASTATVTDITGTTDEPELATTSVAELATTSVAELATTSVVQSATTSVAELATTSVAELATTSVVQSATTSDAELATTSVAESATTVPEVCSVPPPPLTPQGLFRCNVQVHPGEMFGPPRFPAHLSIPTGTQCFWVIIPNSLRPLQLRFLYFDLPKSPNCTAVRLSVYQGLNSAVEPIATFCGPLEQPSFVIGSGIMTAFLFVNEVEECGYRGFHAVFEESQNP